MPTTYLSSGALLVQTADGRWAPGIGDPTPLGWLTVAAYLAAAWLCARASLAGEPPGAREARAVWAWRALACMLVVLGINKQLDLQSLLTVTARDLALRDGWYERRRPIQVWFIRAVVVASLVVVGTVGVWLRRHLREFALAGTGAAFIATFVLVRASSFHKVDAFLHGAAAGFRMNWILELGGIACIAWGAGVYLRGLRHAGEPSGHAGRTSE